MAVVAAGMAVGIAAGVAAVVGIAGMAVAEMAVVVVGMAVVMAVGIAAAVVGTAGIAAGTAAVAAAGCPFHIADKSPARLVSASRSFDKSPCSFLRCIVRSFFTSDRCVD